MISNTNILESSVPANQAEAVTTSDTVNLSGTARALYIGGGGNVNLIMPDGSTVLFVGVGSGSVLPVRVRRVMATSTTATSIVALY